MRVYSDRGDFRIDYDMEDIIKKRYNNTRVYI